MKKLVGGFMIFVVLSCVISKSIKREEDMSDLAKANAEALSKDGDKYWPCMPYQDLSCMEWIVLSSGVAAPIYYPEFVNYQEVL